MIIADIRDWRQREIKFWEVPRSSRSSKDLRDEPVRNSLAVPGPGGSVLRPQPVLVVPGAQDKEQGGAQRQGHGHEVGATCGGRNGDVHDDVPDVVGVADPAPRAGHDQGLSSVGRDRFQVWRE